MILAQFAHGHAAPSCFGRGSPSARPCVRIPAAGRDDGNLDYLDRVCPASLAITSPMTDEYTHVSTATEICAAPSFVWPPWTKRAINITITLLVIALVIW
jgi:hypothetical protein